MDPISTPHRSHESLSQAAARTGMCIKTLRRRFAAVGGQLTAYRSGCLIRVDPVEVDRTLVRIPTAASSAW